MNRFDLEGDAYAAAGLIVIVIAIAAVIVVGVLLAMVVGQFTDQLSEVLGR